MTMPSKMPSRQLVATYSTLLAHTRCWLSNREISAKVPAVPERTVRSLTARLRDAGLLEERRLFGGFVYRALPPNPHVLREMMLAGEAMGIEISAVEGKCLTEPV